MFVSKSIAHPFFFPLFARNSSQIFELGALESSNNGKIVLEIDYHPKSFIKNILNGILIRNSESNFVPRSAVFQHKFSKKNSEAK